MTTTIIIPDIHGDFDELCNILYKFNILKELSSNYLTSIMRNNEYSKLNMNNKILIQLGDILDSKTRTIEAKKHELKYTDMLVFIFLCNLKKTFPKNVILIIGNHEYLNYNKIFNCVSEYSHRNIKEIEYIKKSIDKYFQYYYIDIYKNLYIHSSLPDNLASINMLDSYNTKLKSTNNFVNNYHQIFTRKIPTINQLNLIGINRIFMGHTPYQKITIYNNRIYYCDISISKSFPIYNYNYEIITIDNLNNIKFNIIKRFNIINV